MSIVYDDIQAVTRLLQEKEKVSEAKHFVIVFRMSFVSEMLIALAILGFRANGAYR